MLIVGTAFDIVTHLYFAHRILTLYPTVMPVAAIAVILHTLYYIVQVYTQAPSVPMPSKAQ